MFKFTAVFLIFVIALSKHCWAGIQIEEIEDNDFAEFEDFEEDNIKSGNDQPVTEKSLNDQNKAREDIYETDLDSIVEVLV